MKLLKRYKKEKKAFEQHSKKVDKAYDDFQSAAQDRFNQRANEKSDDLPNNVSQSPWFDALRNGKF
ncbi:hypothetical protein [Exiguobacterium acetylicum]|uniref:hypothetical protein n=1 Tax=Exiguobacterium acetylicum TaxID=41170 RepID=UPI001EE3106C|nr:hypothetical protein [Exiguobacterium acetylicum]UKS54906.1 hypothetical protein K6T22_10110 [Exiguobacterium acetylicum]